MRSYFAMLALLATVACGPIISMSQPVVLGQPGTVYQPTEADISVDVVNNSKVVGDVLVGQTLVYQGVQPQEIRNVGFNCGGLVILSRTRINTGNTGNRKEYIYFRPQDGRYQTLSKSVSVNCGSSHHQKDQFRITSLPTVR